MVDRGRIELPPKACKAPVLPLSLTAHNWLRSQDSNLASRINSPLPTPSLLHRNIQKNLVRVERFELPTLWSQTRCANQTALHTDKTGAVILIFTTLLRWTLRQLIPYRIKTWCPTTESNCRIRITKPT